MVFLCAPPKKLFLINSKLQRFFLLLKVMTLLCSQTIGLFLFSLVSLGFLRNSFTLIYRNSSQSSISLIITSTVLDLITLLLWLSQSLSIIFMKVLKTIGTLLESSRRKQINLSDIDICITDSPITRVQEDKLLVSNLIGVLCKAKRYTYLWIL